jgi:hypothetical protein
VLTLSKSGGTASYVSPDFMCYYVSSRLVGMLFPVFCCSFFEVGMRSYRVNCCTHVSFTRYRGEHPALEARTSIFNIPDLHDVHCFLEIPLILFDIAVQNADVLFSVKQTSNQRNLETSKFPDSGREPAAGMYAPVMTVRKGSVQIRFPNRQHRCCVW